MSKLFKKSLAFCVAIAMVFTLFAGTISVNAEDAEETLTVTLEVTNTTVEDGAAQVTFPLAVTCSGDTSINVLRLVITTTAGKVSNVVSAAETDDYTISYNGDRALLNAGTEVDSLGGFTTANLLVTVDLNEGLDKEAYDITIDARSENASDANENALKISYETGYIRLLAHTHELSETYTYDANGHWQVCTSDYCEVEGGYTTEVAAHVWENDGDPVYTDCVSNGTQAQKCVCGATTTVEVAAKGHNFVDGKCECGEEETVAPSTFTVTFKDEDGTVLKTEEVEAGAAAIAPELPKKLTYSSAWDKAFDNITEDTVVTVVYTAAIDTNKGIAATMILGDTFGLKFTYTHERAGITQSSQIEDIYLVVSQEDFDGTTAIDPRSTVLYMDECELDAVNDSNAPVVAFRYMGIAAKEMTCNISVRFYYQVNGVLSCSKLGTTNLAKLALSQMKKREDMRTLCMDMLNYGAEAQKYFGDYNGNAYANEVTSNTDAVANYASYATQANPNLKKDLATVGDHQNGAGLAMRAILGNSVQLRVAVKQGTNTFDETTKFIYSYTTTVGGDEGKEIAFGDPAWKQNEIENGKHNYYIAVAAKDLRQPITFATYDAEGNAITKVATTSIAGYIATQVNKGEDDLDNVFYALMKFSDSAKVYFS